MKSLKTNPVFRFFASLKLAVFSLLVLAGVLAYGTIVESYFGMRGAKVMVYGTPWFAGVLLLLGMNVACAALIRYPWKRHQTGFAITHLGILILLAGSAITQWWGVDGNLPITEGTANGEVILNDPKLILTDDDTNERAEFPIPETARPASGRLLEIKVTPTTRLVMDTYYPRLSASRQVLPSRAPELGAPAVHLEIYNERFKMEEWLIAGHPEKPTELNLGPALVSFSKAWTVQEEQSFRKKPTAVVSKGPKRGFLIARFRGKEYRADIDKYLKNWGPLGASGLELYIEKYFSYAVVQNNELVDKSGEPRNPAVQLLVRNREGTEEKHTIFLNFPEFSTLHRAHSKGKERLGISFQMMAGGEGRASLAFVGENRGELRLLQSFDGKRVFYRVLGAGGKSNAEGEIVVGQEVATGWMDLRFRVTQWYPQAVTSEEPIPVDYISGGTSEYLSGAHWRIESERAPASDPGFWLIEGGTEAISVAGRKINVGLEKEKFILPFQIHLQKFHIGHDPGTTKAASYQSTVSVNDPSHNEGTPSLISMNEPLKYGGYTFYQASYHMSEGQPPVSILSVNWDPGRPVKYLGSLVMVLGMLLMFYMNPHYWDIVLGRRKKEGNA